MSATGSDVHLHPVEHETDMSNELVNTAFWQYACMLVQQVSTCN